MKSIRLISLILAVVFTCSTRAGATQSADDILSAVANKLANVPSAEISFNLDGEESMAGTMVLSGARFAMNTPVISVWFDGTTQWTLLHSAGEVNITEPSADELMGTNPFAILRNYSNYYRARRLNDFNGLYRVELKPLQSGNSDVDRAEIAVDSNYLPKSIKIYFTGGSAVVATINNISIASAKPLSAFQLDEVQCRNLEIIDLR